jgi:hypothetical protein
MPPLTRWYIKSAMVCLALGLLLGVAQSLPGRLPGPLAAAGQVYVHLLTVGWVTQMIFGVAYWMFPKHSVETPRGSDLIAVLVFALLNLGLAARVLAEPVHAVWPGAASAGLLVVAALAQWLAGVGFVLNTWARVKEK